jgi:hypothetical protein
MGVTHLMRGVTIPWRRGLPPPWRGKGEGLGRTLPWAASPFSYIYVGHAPLLHTLSCFHPLPCCSTLWLLLKRSATEIVSHQHLEKWWRRRSSSGSLLPMPRWTEGMEDVTELYVWPSTVALPVVAPCTRSCDYQVKNYVDYVKWTTTLTTSSERLRRLRASLSILHRQRLYGNVKSRFRSSRVSLHCYHLVDVLG